MLKLAPMITLVLCVGGSPALADDLLWARKSAFGGLTTISVAQNGTLFCTGCNFNNYGPIVIQRGPGVDNDVVRIMEPYISTLWVVLFYVDGGSSCEGEFYSISLNTHNLEHVDKSALGCNSANLSVTEKGLGMVLTITDGKGHRAVHEIQ